MEDLRGNNTHGSGWRQYIQRCGMRSNVGSHYKLFSLAQQGAHLRKLDINPELDQTADSGELEYTRCTPDKDARGGQR